MSVLDKIYEKAKDRTEDVVEKINSADLDGDGKVTFKEKVQFTAGKVADKSKAAYAEAKDKAVELGGKAKDAFAEAKEKAADAIDTAKQKIQEKKDEKDA